MRNDQASNYCEIVQTEVLHSRDRQKRRPAIERRQETVGPWSYLAKVGRGTIRLSAIEYRILMLLASRPYHAFSRRRIADAVSTETQPVPVERLGQYVRSLRQQLGFYADYVQSVPYIGYRFKA